MSQKTSKPSQKPPKKRGPYTPAPVRSRVIARHINGQSNRDIAIVEGIDRDTVGRILSQREVVQMIAQHQARLLRMVPKAIEVYDKALESDDERVRVAAATKVLEGLQVFHKGGIEQTMEIAHRASPEAAREQQRLLLLGGLTSMTLEKSHRFDLPLPTDLVKVEQEARELLDAVNADELTG
jgi:hypothetical protein